MNKYQATNKQIKQIKAAIKEHGMRGLTWQSVASRPDKIDEFLEAADNLKQTYARVMGKPYTDCQDHTGKEFSHIERNPK